MSWIVGLALLASTLGIGVLWNRRSARSAEWASRPRALIGAELVYMEKTFRIERPIRLVAKVDRVYRLPDGLLVLVDLKSRRSQEVRTTDVIQLSAQKMVLAGSTGAMVSTVGYVSLVGSASRSALVHRRVDLLDDDAIVALARRRYAVLTRQSMPRGADTDRMCEACGFRSTCPRWRQRRVGEFGVW